jgi:hypothetical protein
VHLIPPYQGRIFWGFIFAIIEFAVGQPAFECDESARNSIAITYFVEGITYRDVVPVCIIDPLWYYLGLMRK